MINDKIYTLHHAVQTLKKRNNKIFFVENNANARLIFFLVNFVSANNIETRLKIFITRLGIILLLIIKTLYTQKKNQTKKTCKISTTFFIVQNRTKKLEFT